MFLMTTQGHDWPIRRDHCNINAGVILLQVSNSLLPKTSRFHSNAILDKLKSNSVFLRPLSHTFIPCCQRSRVWLEYCFSHATSSKYKHITNCTITTSFINMAIHYNVHVRSHRSHPKPISSLLL
jgi:hypothetical protein